MLTLLSHLSQSWTEGAIRSLDGLRRGFSDAYPIDEDPPPVTPYEVVYEGGKVRLRYYQAVGRPQATPLVVVFPLVKRPYVLDLLPGRSVVQNLIGQGFNVYLTDWIPPSRSDSWRGFDAYVNGDLANVVRAVQIREGVKNVSLLGYCFGALLVIMYTALHQETVKNLITLSLPLDLSVREVSSSNLLDKLSPATIDLLLATYGNCPAWALKMGFDSMSPIHTLLDKYVGLYRNQDKEGYAEMFDLFEKWLNTEVPVAGEVFRTLVKDIFQKNLLVKSRFQVGGRTVNLKNITCPVLNIVGEYDDVVHPNSSMPFADLVGSSDARNLLVPTGHMGVAVSGVAYKKLWPQLGAWLKERDEQRGH